MNENTLSSVRARPYDAETDPALGESKDEMDEEIYRS